MIVIGVANAEQENTAQIRVEALLIKASPIALMELGIPCSQEVMDKKEKILHMPDRKKLLMECAKRDDVPLFSYPTITVLEGKKGGMNVTEPVQYMMRIKKGLYALRTFKDPVGTVFEITAKILDDKTIWLHIDFSVKKLIGRESVPEAKYLDIGEPIFDGVGHSSIIKLKDREVICAAGSKEGNGQMFLIFITASVM